MVNPEAELVPESCVLYNVDIHIKTYQLIMYNINFHL